jgi:hypothetical protein
VAKGALRSVDNISFLSQYKYSTLSREEQRQKQGFVKNKNGEPVAEPSNKGSRKLICEKKLKIAQKKVAHFCATQ